MQFNFLQKLVAIDSPSGFTAKADRFIFDSLQQLGLQPRFTNKGAVKCCLTDDKPVLGIAAHVDTLGAVVSNIKPDGTLQISKVGGLSLNGAEGSYCRIYTLDDKVFTGTLLLNNPAAHVNKDLNSALRSESNMHIRLDEVVNTDKEVELLGIRNGDFICVEPHYQELESGFIKSRFMDNKAGCMVLYELARYYSERGETAPVELFFSNYEEVGHGGAAGYDPHLSELLVIDMGVVGDGQKGSELACSICAKDASGPYDYAMRRELIQLAIAKEIAHVVDVYPYYSSDGSIALRAGHDLRVALIGPGVSASHGVERTHKQGIAATVQLCIAYIEALRQRLEA